MATTTNYGWETPDDTDLVKDGALAMRTTANSIDATLGTALNNKLHAGLVLVKTQTIGTGVTSVTVTNAFSATYDNYKIVVSGGVGSTAGGASLHLQIGGSVTGYAFGGLYISYSGGSPTSYSTSSSQSKFLDIANSGANYQVANIEIGAPFLTKFTTVATSYATGSLSVFYTGIHKLATSYTDFTFDTSSGNFTGGTIAVYGYAKD